jgi:NDP-sugar pyrophosphorylase family protein
LKNAEAWLCTGGGAFLLANGDVWHDFDLSALQAAHDDHSIATLAVHRAPHRPELHTVAVVSDRPGGGSVAHIRGQPLAKDSEFRVIYTGVGVFGCRLLAQIPAGRQACLVQDGLLPAMARGDSVRWIEPAGHWFDCGTRAEVLRASAFALRARCGTQRHCVG